MAADKFKLPSLAKRQLSRSSSNNSLLNGGGIKNFHKLGGKVKNLIKIKRAFGADDTEDVITTVKLLPSEPRFSSSLSPAAQFAMMKCYEDTVYEHICKQFPASKVFLRRNRTPTRAFIDLNDNTGSGNMAEVKEEASEKENSSGDEQNGDFQETIQTNLSNEIDLSSSQNSCNTEKFTNTSNHLVRPQSLPAIVGKSTVPREKRIILSQRLQSAMDILDTVRDSSDRNTISPRIKQYPRKIHPVSDFNQWSSVWSNEFKIIK